MPRRSTHSVRPVVATSGESPHLVAIASADQAVSIVLSCTDSDPPGTVWAKVRRHGATNPIREHDNMGLT